VEGFKHQGKGGKDNAANVQLWCGPDWPLHDSILLSGYELVRPCSYSWQGGVIYLLYTEVFAKDSKISHFNKAVDRIRADPQVREILGSGTTIKAYGEPTLNKLQRARPIS
jgi:hypothetical protein